ncbi:leucyl/phenylalanyl-tRNA--protein transferase [Sphingobacterium sp. SYP-B4668]|uniref:leucyl/phenylalanyl-tRNA--protein transferase n=1 Tax=Sphingobacterium sp. SYP-B4668 TaxID=2996035 RepID=UPI0022DD5E92|nr:leucyl/phenylalanyl-tRNA--protein transferase [Sphingobacterium sp. SYP-B4668]
MIFQLDKNELTFPHPSYADDDGLLAIGGDLSTERLILAYENGIFPWFSDDSPILWYAPHNRFVIFPERLRVSKSMRQTIRKGIYTTTCNQSFATVIQRCAQISRKDQEGTWITHDMIQAYITLYNCGYAHSIEVWEGKNLVGGLYGVMATTGIFCGESMFSETSNASKIALIDLFHFFNLKFVDCQFHTDHLASMGGEMISQEDYLEMLNI